MDNFSQLSPKDLPSTDTQLLRAAGDQDVLAWRQLLFVYAPVIRYWIIREGVRSRADVDDIFQDVCLAVSQHLAKFKRESGKAKFRAWLKTVTHSKLADFWRVAEKNSPGQGGSTAQRQIEEIAEELHDESLHLVKDAAAEDRILLARALFLLKQEFQESSWRAFELTVLEGRSAPEAASELKSTSVAIRKAKSRVLYRLRELLDGDVDRIDTTTSRRVGGADSESAEVE